MPNFDPAIADGQIWLNQWYATAPGYVPAPEDGRTGWPTIRSLITALQIEVGVPSSQITTSFGPLTLSLLTSKYGNIGPQTTSDTPLLMVVNIVKLALYCKGYSGGSYDYTYSATVEQSVGSLRSNMGFTDSRSTLSPQEFKALLSMDAYVLVGSGTAEIREVQQWLNRTYYSQSWFSIIPADGFFSRNVQKGLVSALQKELGVAEPTGAVGPQTLSSLQARPAVTVNATDTAGAQYVRLLQAALRFNKYPAAFSGTFTSGDSGSCTTFQQFMHLPVTGKGDYQTWCSLLTSSGDTTRPATACDTSTPLTSAKAATLAAAGYSTVGLYLTNATSPGAHNKKIQPGELAILEANNIRVYPIFQTYGGSASYFKAEQGAADAKAAILAARQYGFPAGAVIYFAIDFDATDDDVTSNVQPHFEGIRSVFRASGDHYKVGVYGSRNPCTRLADAELTAASMVLGMSNGYSGNLGFPMPQNWAWDQFATIAIGSGTGAIEIDKNARSAIDAAHQPQEVAGLDVNIPAGPNNLVASIIDKLASVPPPGVPFPLRTLEESAQDVVTNDPQLTVMAAQLGIRKALIQAVAFWEHWSENASDVGGDIACQETLEYDIKMFEALRDGTTVPFPPSVNIPDSTTGFAQIFAKKTAEPARNWAGEQGLIANRQWSGVYDHLEMFLALKNDVDFNLATAGIVLLWGAVLDVGLSQAAMLALTDVQTKQVLARYNGFGSDAALWAESVFEVYEVFEQFNASVR